MPINSTLISIIFLAAGESSRLGTPKQLLLYQGKTLLQHSIDLALSLGIDTYIVLGAFKEKILSQVDVSGTKVVVNEGWNKGLSSSIRYGLKEVLKANPNTEAIMFVLCDQPFLTSSILSQIVAKYHSTAQPIVHCSYGDATGPPTLFDKYLFPYLMELKGNQGAKKVVDMFPEKVTYIDFPEGKFDIDTLDDYDQLKQTE